MGAESRRLLRCRQARLPQCPAARPQGQAAESRPGNPNKIKRPRLTPIEEYALGNEKAFLARSPDRGLLFKFGDEVQTPRDFEWQVERRFSDWDAAWAEAIDIVRGADPGDLKSQHRFYEHVYKPHRDKLAARWSAQPAAAPG